MTAIVEHIFKISPTTYIPVTYILIEGIRGLEHPTKIKVVIIKNILLNIEAKLLNFNSFTLKEAFLY